MHSAFKFERVGGSYIEWLDGGERGIQRAMSRAVPRSTVAAAFQVAEAMLDVSRTRELPCYRPVELPGSPR